MTESMAWYSIEGKVSRVIDGRTILITVADNKQLLRVHLAGIALEPHPPYPEEAKGLLEKMVSDKNVEVMVNQHIEWLDKLPAVVTGVVYRPSDIGLSLLTQGLAHFREPRPFTMSRYTGCQYQRAEAEARSKKLGLWEASSKASSP